MVWCDSAVTDCAEEVAEYKSKVVNLYVSLRVELLKSAFLCLGYSSHGPKGGRLREEIIFGIS